MSFAGLPHSFLIGTLAGAVCVGISIPSTALITSFFPNLKKRVDALKPKEYKNYIALGHSTLHALLQIIGTYSFVYGSYDQDHHHKITNDPHVGFDTSLFVDYGGGPMLGFGPTFYMGLFVGYLLADAVYIGYEYLGPMFTAHHYTAAACWTMNAYLSSMQRLACQLQFCEFSTVFMNLRQLLLTAGYKSSSAIVTLTTMVFFFTFGLVRVYPLPDIVYQWWTREFNIILEQNGAGPAAATTFFIGVHVFLQSMWFSMMIKKIVGMVGGGGGKKKTKDEQETKKDD